MDWMRPLLGSRTFAIGAVVTAGVLAVATAFFVISLMGQSPETAEPSPSASPSGSSEASASPLASATPSSKAVALDAGILQALVDGLEVRESPSAQASVVATIFTGQLVWATGHAQEHAGTIWIEVHQQPTDRRGWVAAADPDGNQSLAMVRDGVIGITSGRDVQLIDPRSDERTPATSGMNVHDIAFSPDGTQVALIDPFSGPLVAPLGSTTSPKPTPEPSGPAFGPPAMVHPAFAPNGKMVAYLVGQDLLALSLIWLGDGSAPMFATPPTVFPMSWAPDSRHLASTQLADASGGDSESWSIVVAEEGGAEPIQLTDANGIDFSPSWSPDGSTIAYLRQVDAGTLALMVMAMDGSHQRSLLTFDGPALSQLQPAWSPDGSRIAVAQSLKGYPAMVHLVDAHTSRHLTIAVPLPQCTDLTWSPTGARIAFVCADDRGASMAYRARLDGSNLTELGAARQVDWARQLERLSFGTPR